MTSSRRSWMIGGMALVMISVASSSSWAWRGGYGWHGGWGWYGPGVGLYLGGPYDPYYYPYGYGYPDPYAYPAYDTTPGYMATASPEEDGDVSTPAPVQGQSARTLKGVERTVSALEAQVNNDYDDGDITSDQRKERIKALKEIRDEARQEAKAYNGKLTPEQADVYLNRLYGRKPQEVASVPSASTQATVPSNTMSTSSPRSMNGISDLLLELRSLLDQKLKDGDITKGQAQSERRNLDQLEQEARQDANANGGNLSSDDENALTEQLHRAYYQINHNFVE